MIKPRKKRSFFMSLKGLILFSILGFGVWYFGFVNPSLLSQWASLPFPKSLVSVRLLHNGEELLLKPNEQPVLKAGDSIQLLDFQTDGWVSLGTQLDSRDVIIGALEKPVALKTLWPEEVLETPKQVEIWAFSGRRSIGKVSFVVRLEARDWLRMALAASGMERKVHCFKKTLEEDPQNTLVKTQLANLYFENKNYGDAVRLYKEILQLGKSKPVLERLLSAHQLQNQEDEALGTYLELLQISKDRKEFDGFLRYLQEHKSKEEMGQFIAQHEKEFPKDFYKSLLLVLAESNVKDNDWAGAAAMYERAVKAGIEDSNIFYNLAVAYEQDGNSEQAVQMMDRYLQENPEDVQSLVRLGELQEKKGNLKQARATYESILGKKPDEQEALIRLIDLLEKTGDRAALCQAYERLAGLKPQDKVVHFNLAALYYEDKNWEKATNCFKSVADLDSKDVECRKYLLDLYEKQNNIKGQEEALLALILLEPSTMDYHKALFSLYDKTGNYEAIVSFFKKATEQYPNSVTFHQYVLYGALKQRNEEMALGELEHLIRLKPKETKYLQQAAQLYEKQKNYAQALKKTDELLKITPNDGETKENYLRLKRLSLDLS